MSRLTNFPDWILSRWRQSLVLSLTVIGIGVVAAIALIVARVVGHQIESDALSRAQSTAQLVGRSSFAPRLPRPGWPLSAADRRELDAQVAAARTSLPGTQVVLRGGDGNVLYSSAPGAQPADPQPVTGTHVVGQGAQRRVSTVIPVRSTAAGVPVAYLEQDMPYAPVAREIRDRTRRLDLVLALGALALYLLALPSLLKASRAVHAQYDPRRQQLARDLKRAIKHNELSLAYQPIVAADSGRLRSVEALVRWTDPRRGPISPASFIPAIEQTDAIWDLSCHIFEIAFRQCGEWCRQGMPTRVAVNVSGAVLLDRRLVGQLRRLSAEHGIEPDTLELEITEGALVQDPREATRALLQIAAIGLRVIAIDDFGTGYSSLSRLHELPLDTLKIDQSFVRRMAGEGETAIVRSVIDLAHALNMDVIGEGVEDAETAEQLNEMGCEYLQGYHFSRPLPAAEIAEWLERDAGVPFAPGPDGPTRAAV